jgi:hypothetical protein
VACGAAHADEWVSVTKTIEEGHPIDVFVKTPMVRINGDIRDAATKREYPSQKLPDGQSNRFVIEVWHFNCRTQMSQLIAIEGQRLDGTSISMTAHQNQSTWRPASQDRRQRVRSQSVNPECPASLGERSYLEFTRALTDKLKNWRTVYGSNL